MIPTLFGYPLWYGKVKNRRAKKILVKNQFYHILKAQPAFSNMKIGDVVNTCDGFNHKIYNIIPEYQQIGKGFYLINIDLVIDDQGKTCSLGFCGIAPAYSRDKIESNYFSHYKEFQRKIETDENYQGHFLSERVKNRIAILENGGHICDDYGFVL